MRFAAVLIGGAAGLIQHAEAAGTWVKLKNSPPGGLDNPLLLTDGTVMCGNGGNKWYKLTPDSSGSYQNGTWTTLASTTYTRLFFSSEVLYTGNVYVAGGEYGTGSPWAELYNSQTDSWSVIGQTPGKNNLSDAISSILPNGNLFQGSTGSGCWIYNVATNTISNAASAKVGQDEAAWVRLPNDNILTIDEFVSTVEHYVPANNAWYSDANTPVALYGYGGELGPGFVLPNGKAFYIGASSHTAVYTPGATLIAAGTWVQTADIPNNLGAVDAPACMMNNGKILCALGVNSGFGSATNFYEYDYTTDTFTFVTAPGGGNTYGSAEFATTMLQLPDGGVFFIGGQGSTNCYIYHPDGSPLAQGQPTISSVIKNADNSYTLTGVGLAGISAGAAYGDDWQMNTNYPIVKVTDSAGKVSFGRTYNWSSSTIQNPNPVTTQFTLPTAFPSGNYTLTVIVNGNPSVGMAFNTAGTVTAEVTGTEITSVTSSSISLQWDDLGQNQTGYQIQRSTDGTNFSTIFTTTATATTYTDSTVSAFTPYYYRVAGVNAVGTGPYSNVDFCSTLPTTALPSPWLSEDVGAVGGSGASSLTSGVYTLRGSGTSFSGSADQGQFAYQPIAGDGSITARVSVSQTTGVMGVAIRNSAGTAPSGVAMLFTASTHLPQMVYRVDTEDTATTSSATGSFTSPIWLRLVRTGDMISGYYSTNGTTWTLQSTIYAALEPTAVAGLVVSNGNNALMGSATFDNVTIQGTVAPVAPPLVHYKLDETTGTVATDTRSGFDGAYTGGVTLGQAGAIPATINSVKLNGTTGYVACPPLNLNSNLVTMTGWFNSTANQVQRTGLIFCRAGTTLAGLRVGANTNDNLLGYLWGNNNFSNSTLLLPNGTWTFVALVIRPTQAIVYMMPKGGSMQSASFSTTNPPQAFDAELELGQDLNGGPGRIFNGSMDDVQIYDRALSATEIQNLAANLPTTSLTSPTLTNVNIPSNAGLVLTGTAGNASSLQWEEMSGPGTVTFTNGTAANTAAQFSAAGTYVIALTATSSAGMNSVFPLTVNSGAVPYPLVGADVGAPGGTGSTTYNNNGSYTVLGSGANIGGTTDAFQYASMPLGNATIVQTRIISQQSSGTTAKAGVMIRDNITDVGAMYAEMHLTDSSGMTFSWRNATGAASANAHVNNIVPPVWVRVTTTGTTFSGYYSTDGNTWIQVGATQTFTMGASPVAGLEECSGAKSVFTTGNYDHFSLSPVPATINVGPLPLAGSAINSFSRNANLAGSVSDDGRPLPASLTTTWSQVSGPGTITFSNAASPTSKATASANGTYTLRLSATDGQVTTCNDVNATFSAPWLTWLAANFNSTQLANSAISGPNATPANDGIPNLLKYAYGIPPLTSAAGQAGPFSATSGSNLQITYLRSQTATDLVRQLQQSTDLQTWTVPSYTESVLSTSGTVQTIQDTVPFGVNPQLFLRLFISLP